MISCNKGICEAKGSLDEVLADISTLIYAVNTSFTEKYGKDAATEFIERAVKRGFKDEDEIAKEAEDCKGEIVDLLEGLLKIVKEIKDGD